MYGKFLLKWKIDRGIFFYHEPDYISGSLNHFFEYF